MAENIIINDVTYPEVEAISTTTSEGEQKVFYPDAVRYSEQDLKDSEKIQARSNIDAASLEDISNLEETKQPKGDYALKSEIPAVPVKSVNGKTGAVTLTASDVSADPAGTSKNEISSHNTNTTAHNDLRLLIGDLAARLNALANSDDETLDQTAEIVAYIKANRDLIESITTQKINYTDIINDLATNVPNKPLSAAQGVVLKNSINTLDDSVENLGDELRAVEMKIPQNTSDLINDSGFIASIPNEYVTEEELNAKKYLTEQDITGKADKSSAETWTFTLEDGKTVTKKVVLA